MFRQFIQANVIALSIATAAVAGPNHPVSEPAYSLRVGLQGYSPVSYLDNHKAEPGSPRFTAEHNGITYFFTTNAQRQTFVSDPAKYEPAYGGYCAYGCAVNGLFTPNPESFKIIDGKVNLFIKNDQVDTLQLWEQEGDSAMKKKADGFWAKQTQSRAYLNAQNLPATDLLFHLASAGGSIQDGPRQVRTGLWWMVRTGHGDRRQAPGGPDELQDRR